MTDSWSVLPILIGCKDKTHSDKKLQLDSFFCFYSLITERFPIFATDY